MCKMEDLSKVRKEPWLTTLVRLGESKDIFNLASKLFSFQLEYTFYIIYWLLASYYLIPICPNKKVKFV